VNAVKTKFGTIGVLICANSFQENILTEMKAKKPDLMLIPYGWAADEKEWPQLKPIKYNLLYQVYIFLDSIALFYHSLRYKNIFLTIQN
jgi:predicted amidohydrolase